VFLDSISVNCLHIVINDTGCGMYWLNRWLEAGLSYRNCRTLANADTAVCQW